MRNLLRILCVLVLAQGATAQELTAERLKRDIRAILPEAAKGFPINNGLVSEDVYTGSTYGTDFSLLGIHQWASLRYEPAHDYKYSKPTNEMFYFSQVFMDTSAAGGFMLENAEGVLDEQGETMGLKKVKVKVEKAFRDDFKVIEYRQLGKPLIVFTHFFKGAYTTLHILSPYRPQDVKVANLLGCMVFSFANMGFLYVVPVYGSALGDKEKVAAAAYAKSGLVESRYQYEWMPGTTTKQVEQKWGKQTSVRVMNSYSVD